MADQLITWLLAQLDEDEEGAMNAARDRHWRPDGAKSCQVYAVRADLSTRTIAWCANGYDDDFANSLHIARHDPARVLAEVEAKRRIMDLHREDVAVCENCDLKWPCATVRLLALPYADRPGYREEWRP